MPIASAFRSVLRWFGFASIVLASPLVWAQGSGSLAADGFDPNVNGNVFALAVQPDGKILIGGSFSEVRPNGATSATGKSNLARVLPSGLLDASFNASVNGQVSAMVVQSNGQIVIGGKFTAVGGAIRNRVARLNAADGSLDATFDPNVGGGLTPEVTSLALQADGKIVVGGGFITAQPNGAGTASARNRIARFNADGTLDAGFDPDANGLVLSLAVQADGKILVGGGFTTIKTVTRNRIARLNTDGSLDTGFDPNANNAVNTIAVLPNGNILIGGSFTTLGTATATRLARLDTNGAISSGFTGSADGPVHAITALADGRILVGGSFSSAGGGGQAYVSRLLPGGTIDTTFFAGPNFNVYAMAAQPDGSVVLGGGFTTLRGAGLTPVVRNHVARVSSIGALDTDFHPDANGRLRTVAVQSDGKVLVGGSFTSVGGVTHSGIVRLEKSGKVDASFNAVVAGTVAAIVVQGDGQIVIGGSFSRVNGATRVNLARLKADGSTDAYDPAPNNVVNALALQSDGKVIVGGAFTSLRPNSTAEPVTRNNIARINTDGSLDLTYKLQTNGAVQALTVQKDGKVLLGGAFTVLSADEKTSVQRSGIARMNADGSVDTGFDPNVNGSVSAILVQADNKVVFGGTFAEMRPNQAATVTPRFNVARVNADGTLDATFDPSTNGAVLSLVEQTDGKVLIGGFFTVLRPNGAPESGAKTRRYLARINGNGTFDDSFDLNLNDAPGNVVTSLVKKPDGEILIGGAFTSLGNVRRNRIAQTNATGTIDESFNAAFNTATGPAVETITVQTDGSVIVAGAFSQIGGSGSAGLAAFQPEGIPNNGFVPTINGKVNAVSQHITGDPVPTQKTGLAWLQSTGRLRPGFTFPANLAFESPNTVVVQPDGKVLIAGIFTLTVDSKKSTHRLMRFNADGSIDSTFTMNIVDNDKDNDGTPDATDPDIDGDGTNNDTDTDDDGDGILDVNEDPNAVAPVTVSTITAITLQSDGKILIGGTFTAIDNTARTNFARLNANGTLDTSITCNANAAVRVITLASEGKIILGGEFTTLQGGGDTAAVTRNFIGRIDAAGKVDTPFDPSLNAVASSILVRADGKILVGGQFTAVKPNAATTTTSRIGLALFNTDGTLDTAVDYKLNNAVATLRLQADGKVLIAGHFTTILGQPRNYIARLNADNTLDAAFNPNPNGAITSVALQSDGKILVTGAFSGFQANSSNHDAGLTTPRSFAARLNADGTLDSTFNPNFNNSVFQFAVAADNSIVAIGAFSSIQPIGSLLVGGSFTSVSGVPVSNLALFGRDGSISSFQPNPNGAVNAIVSMANGQVVIGGSFTTVAGTARKGIARFLAGDALGVSPIDTAFDPNATGDVYAIALQPDGKLIVGGSFTNIGGAGRTNLARLNVDGSNDASFNPVIRGTVRSIALQADGRILITYENGGGNALVRLTSSGSSDNTFNAANNGAVFSIAVQASGHIVVGGSFTAIGGGARNYLARLDANGTLDSTLAAVPNGIVTALTIQDDGKILIGGTFTDVDGLPRFGLARVGAPVAAASTFTTDAGRSSITWLRSGGAPEVQSVVFERSADAITWTNVGEATRIAGTSNWSRSGLSLGSSTVYVRARAIVPGSPGSSTGVVSSQSQLYVSSVVVPAVPVINSAGAVNGASGSAFNYAITATGLPTSFAATGLPPGLTINTTTGLISGTPTVTGNYTVTITASNSLGSGSATLTIIVGPPGSVVDSGRIVNLSVLAPVSSSNPIIAGFVITGSGTQDILLRAVGPGLSFFERTDSLANPTLRVFNQRTGATIHESTNWGGDSALSAAFARLGAFPLNATSADAAVILKLAPGPYTFHVTAPGTTSGSALAEVYDASLVPVPSNSPRLINIAARGVITGGSQLVTSGFVISGTTPKRVLIRGIGPGLTPAPRLVPNALADTVVTLNKIGTGGGVIARNDNWETPVTVDSTYPAATGAQIAAAAVTTGAFSLATGSADSAILVTLPPGIYTAQVGSATNVTGATMVEVYELP